MSSPDELLSFKEFTPTNNSESATINVNSPQKNQYTFLSSVGVGGLLEENADFLTAGDLSDGPVKSDKLNGEGDQTDKMVYSLFTIEYYQQFFNVDTVMVVDRIFTSMIPKRAPGNYLKAHIGLNPDLYGPFWIVITLIFSIAISGNIASYMQASVDEVHQWKYNFHLVSMSATAIIFYAVGIPLALWAAFKFTMKPVDPDLETEMSSYTPNLLSLVCVYGYSLAIYIPVSILWVIQVNFLQWLLVLTAAFLSGSVLVFILMPALRNSNISLFIVIGIISAHFLLAAGFMLKFFHSVDTDPVVTHAVSPGS